jgi:type IV pilus assembly protein PilB
MGKLTEIDINEILTEQNLTKQAFGAIALRWGLCEPKHIWKAWCSQLDLAEGPPGVDLDRMGVDASATMCICAGMARRHRVVPIRVVEDQLVLACMLVPSAEAMSELRSLHYRLRFVLAGREQIEKAIETYYPHSRLAVSA